MSRPAIWFLATVGVAIGVAVVILGGADDSPGLQLIGVVIVIVSAVLGVRALRRTRPVR